MKTQKQFTSSVVILAVAMGFLVSARADDDPKYSVQTIMKAVFKGEDSVNKRILKGKASKEDLDKLVEYVSVLPQNDPPQGDPDGWKKKTTALLTAAKALQAGGGDALAQYTKAANCQACHSVYRPD
jgi:cytochrome c556